jgi:formate dehydrogenase subunit gamma
MKIAFNCCELQPSSQRHSMTQGGACVQSQLTVQSQRRRNTGFAPSECAEAFFFMAQRIDQITKGRGRSSWNTEVALERIRECLDREGALLPILHALQEEFGYIDEAAEPLIAEALNITRAEVHGVITFYHDFRRAPAGRHVLKLRRAEACQAAGGDPLAAHAAARLGVEIGTTAPDGSVTLEPVYCLGLCAVAPSAMLDGRLVGRLDQARLDALLAEAQQ